MSILLTVILLTAFPVAAAQAPAPAGTLIKTENGDFLVPGRAYLDGRDLEAEPRFTLMNLRIWQSPFRTQALCTAEHGTQVNLLDVQHRVEEKMYYFLVRAPQCEGWVPHSSLSLKKHPPVGARR